MLTAASDEEGNEDAGAELAIRRLVPGGDPTVLVQGGQRVVPASDAAFAIAATRSGWKVVRVDPATGRTRPVRVGGRTFFPFAVSAGDGLVAVSGQSGGSGRTYLIDAVSGAIRGTLATDGPVSPADEAAIVAGTLLTTHVGTGTADALWAAPVKRRMALEEVDRCDCVYVPLGSVPGGAWFARLPTTPQTWSQGGNDFGGAGWGGPCPPARHAYVFTLYRAPGPVRIDGPLDPPSVHDAFRAAGGSAQSFSAFFGE